MMVKSFLKRRGLDDNSCQFSKNCRRSSLSWCIKTYREKHSVECSSVHDCKGMETHDFRNMPPVEAHLHPKISLSSPGAVLPNRAVRFQVSLTDKAYKAAGLAIRALNAASLLMAYQAELEEDMLASADPGL